MLKWVLASNNKHKAEEILAILKPYGIQLLTMDEAGLNGLDIEETGTTFEENAMIKARTVFELTGLSTLADDSGLMVDYLEGAPGIYSARYSGLPKSDERNNQKLLKSLEGIEQKKRTARFVSVLAFVSKDQSFTVRGEAEGYILNNLTGTGGFGYDPLFYSFEAEKCFGLLSAEIKNKVSHRAKSLEKLKDKLLGGSIL